MLIMISGSISGDVVVWNYEWGTVLATFNHSKLTKELKKAIFVVRLSPCSNYVLAGGDGDTINLW